MKTSWKRFTLIALVFEKIVQHIFVTISFYLNWGDIRSSVAVNPDVLMIMGAVVAVLFILSFWGLIVRLEWAVNLVIALALFDILGEFVAQGTMIIAITVSFVVAVALLVVAFAVRRTERQGSDQT